MLMLEARRYQATSLTANGYPAAQPSVMVLMDTRRSSVKHRASSPGRHQIWQGCLRCVPLYILHEMSISLRLPCP